MVKENLNLKKICFCKIDEDAHIPFTTADCQSLDEFWIKLGFEKCDDTTVIVEWRDVCAEKDSPHKLVYWLKTLPKD